MDLFIQGEIAPETTGEVLAVGNVRLIQRETLRSWLRVRSFAALDDLLARLNVDYMVVDGRKYIALAAFEDRVARLFGLTWERLAAYEAKHGAQTLREIRRRLGLRVYQEHHRRKRGRPRLPFGATTTAKEGALAEAVSGSFPQTPDAPPTFPCKDDDGKPNGISCADGTRDFNGAPSVVSGSPGTSDDGSSRGSV